MVRYKCIFTAVGPSTAKPVDSRHGKIGLVHNTANGDAETRQRKIGSITEPVPQLGGSIDQDRMLSCQG
ncbi:hypothetical protein OUZ56_029090 [Daphnia magna]|uniref:Uncharacterized protein n=1 Tax=Daphnia magna TaxID=35525 RepID=A0ABR0B5T8_9CRUS|nr:hypothetical protein OUZ56_029090 [Daphnia magna]